MKKLLLVIVLAVMMLIPVACAREADVASQNLSIAADQFEVYRRVIFYNGITNEYMLVVEGLCSLGNYDVSGELSITCKTGPGEYKKHFLGLSDNVTYFVEQLQSKGVNAYHYRVVFRPSVIVPDIEVDLP
jgi:hypothetical protein